MKDIVSGAFEVACPFDDTNKDDSDSIHINWLMKRYGHGIAMELFEHAVASIVREFYENPQDIKNIKFTVITETI